MASVLNGIAKKEQSLGSWLMAILLSSVITALFLLVFALPYFYHLDPTGWGEKIGVKGKVMPTEAVVASTNSGRPVQALTPQENVTKAESVPVTQEADDPLSVREDNVQLVVMPQQTVDYRLAMERDYDLDYYWSAQGNTVYSELRGESNDKKVVNKTFGKLNSTSGKGFFITPFTGQFGWHWQNKTDQSITLHLHTKGHYRVVGQIEQKISIH